MKGFVLVGFYVRFIKYWLGTKIQLEVRLHYVCAEIKVAQTKRFEYHTLFVPWNDPVI